MLPSEAGAGSATEVANNYRVVYAIEDRQPSITVVKVGHRWEVYR